MRTETYLEHRNEVSTAVRHYLAAHDVTEQDSRIYALLDALGADEAMKWGWYHANLSVDEVLGGVGAHLRPGDEQALLLVLDAVAAEQDHQHRLQTTPSDERRNLFLMRAGMSLLASSGADGTTHLPPWLVGRPEYADSLSTYIQAVAPRNPEAVARLLNGIEDAGVVTYDAQWLRLYAALGRQGEDGAFDGLARAHAPAETRTWTLRLRAATFLAERQRPGLPDVGLLIDGAPPALGDDVLYLARHSDPVLFEKLLKRETRTTAALLAAA
jgi:hypothetical protein